MDEELLNKFREQDEKLNKIFRSVEKIRKYFLWTMIITVVTFVLPLIAFLIFAPKIMSLYAPNYLNF